MTTDIARRLESSLSLNSLSDLVSASETVMLLIDTSGSMTSYIPSAGKRAIDLLREVVAEIQKQGNVPMIAFGGPWDAQVRFVDIVPEPDGGTPLHAAIAFAKQYGANRLVVISDGCPDLREESLREAKEFGGRIDVCYIGAAGDGGSVFLNELARITGGTRFNGDIGQVKQLAGKVIGLLMGDVAPARSPIQGEGFTAEETTGDEPDADDEFDDDDDDEEEKDEEDGDEN